jgi:hypothetical protein
VRLRSVENKQAVIAEFTLPPILFAGGDPQAARQVAMSRVVSSLALAPDGNHGLCGDSHGFLRIWDLTQPARLASGGFAYGKSVGKTVSPGSIRCIAISPDGALVLSGHGRHSAHGSIDRNVRLWETATKKELARFIGHTGSLGHSGDVVSVAFASDGKRALSGGGDNTIRLWHIDAARAAKAVKGVPVQQEVRRFEGHTGRVTAVAFTPDGRRALSGSWTSPDGRYHSCQLAVDRFTAESTFRHALLRRQLFLRQRGPAQGLSNWLSSTLAIDLSSRSSRLNSLPSILMVILLQSLMPSKSL